MAAIGVAIAIARPPLARPALWVAIGLAVLTLSRYAERLPPLLRQYTGGEFMAAFTAVVLLGPFCQVLVLGLALSLRPWVPKSPPDKIEARAA